MDKKIKFVPKKGVKTIIFKKLFHHPFSKPYVKIWPQKTQREEAYRQKDVVIFIVQKTA